MTHDHWVWFAYILTAVITLLSKMASYAYKMDTPRTQQSLFWHYCRAWLFEKTLANGADWVGTVCIVWAFGYLFINKVVAALGYFGGFFQVLPVAVPIAALLGWAAEMGAPKLMIWIINKFTPNG